MTESPNPALGISPEEARAALDAVRATQHGVRERLVVPRGYDAIYSATCGLLVFAVALTNAQGGFGLKVIGAVLLGVGFGAFISLMRWFRRVNGFWVSGITPPRARWAAWGAGVAAGAGMVGASLAAHADRWWLVAVVVFAVAAAAYGFSRLWLAVYRAAASRA